MPFQEVQPDSNQLIPRILFEADIGRRRRPPVPGPRRRPPAPPPRRRHAGRLDRRRSRTAASPSRCAAAASAASPSTARALGPGGLGLHLRRDTTDTWTFHTDRWEEPVEATLAPRRLGGRGDRPAARPRPPRRPPAPLPRAPDRHASAAASRASHLDARGQLRRALHPAADAGRRSPRPPRRWTDGLADGHVDREPSPAEWPFLGWSRLRVGDTDLGLATSDVYSHSLDGSLWQPTLLRSPRMAWGGGDPRTYAGRDQHTDQGVHRFALDPALRRHAQRARPGRRRSPTPPSRSSSSTATRAWTGRPGARCRRAGCGARRCCATSPTAASPIPGRTPPAASSTAPARRLRRLKEPTMTLTDQQRIERLAATARRSSSSGPSAPASTLDGWSFNERAPRPRRRLADPRRRRRPSPSTASRSRPTGRSRRPASTSTSAARACCASPTPAAATTAFGLDPNHQRFPLRGPPLRGRAPSCVARLPFGVPEPRRPPRPRPPRPDRPRARRAHPPAPPGRARPPRCSPATRSSRRCSPPPRTR